MSVSAAPPRNVSKPADEAPLNVTNTPDAPTVPKKAKQRWIRIQINEAQSQGLREMARVAGGKADDFYTSLLTPGVTAALADFNENREIVSARAKAKAAQTAAEKARALADKAAADLAEAESKLAS